MSDVEGTEGTRSRFAAARAWSASTAGRIVTAILVFIAGGVVAVFGEHLLAGGTDTNELRVATFQDWRLVCPPASQANSSCALTEEVQRDVGGTLITLSLTSSAIGSNITVTVPHGVQLEPGMGFSLGNDPMRVRPYETCTNIGCIAFVALDADTLKGMQGNAAGQVVVIPGGNPGANASPVTIPFSLKGFADGFAGLQKAQARRNSFLSFLSR